MCGPSLVFKAVDLPFASPLNFSRVADYVYDFCPLSDQYVGPNVLVCGVEHVSF